MNWLTEGFQEIDLVLSNPGYQTKFRFHQNTAEYNYFIARGELKRGGNLLHGMNHLAKLLTYDPSYPEWINLLERYLSLARENPESLLDEEHRNYYAIEAVRAYIYARQGRYLEALQILDAIAKYMPNTLYMKTWGIDWLSQASVTKSIDLNFTGAILADALNRFNEFSETTYDKQQYLLRYAALTKQHLELRLRQSSNDKQRDSIMRMTYVGFLRKAGCFNEALNTAQKNYRDNPSWYSATAIGLVLREIGHTEAAEKALRQSLEYEPTYIASILEIGDMYFNLGDWQTAKKVYQEVPQNTPQFAWASASILYCDWKLTSERSYLNALLKMASGDSPNHRARQFIEQFYPYIGYLPEPSDAQTNCIKMMMEQGIAYGDSGDYKFIVSCIEAPSNDLALKLAFGDGVNLAVEVENIPEPDPRMAIEPVAYKLWKYDGTKASPALPAPSTKVTDTITKLACKPLKISQLWAAASRTAKQLKDIEIEEILAVMVYPSPVPQGFDALSWLPRLQLTTAFIIAHYDTGWLDSTRRDALYSLLLGTRDWTTVAAIIAMANLAEEHPVLSSDIDAAFMKLAHAYPDMGGCCYEHALYHNWLRIPHLFEKEKDEIRSRLQQIEE